MGPMGCCFAEDIGKVRYIRKFAFIPICIDGEWRWLNTVYLKQMIRTTSHSIDGRRMDCWYWSNEEFLTKEEYKKCIT